MIDIAGLDKAAVLAALYNRARPIGRGVLQFTPEDMTLEQARTELAAHEWEGRVYIDYLHGRVMKVDLTGDEFKEGNYDRDNDDGAAASVIAQLRIEVTS